METIFTTSKPEQKHWYQEPWMFFILGAPAIVIVASIFMSYLAFAGADRVIAPDYYKRGLAINQDIRADLKARELGLEAGLQVDPSTRAVTLKLAGLGELPSTLELRLSRATGNGNDELVFNTQLVKAGDGLYLGKLDWPSSLDVNSSAMWQLNLKSSDWRLATGWYGPIHNAVSIKPAA